ncbi:response regulator transcription factor [Streptomyces sp. KR55]|uniref:response regulator transcription factor n=1 Tax=Streptomyces sp. KR55 TaxID=3457425 RepID=UPI003FD4077F
MCRRIRETAPTPVILLAYGAGPVERVLGLRVGADDCLAKPYDFQELLARIEALSRRGLPGPSPATVTLGALHLDARAREVRVHGRTVDLTRKEFDLLRCLTREARTVVALDRLLREVWHAPSSRASRTLDTHVSALRGKLGEPGVVVTVCGVGLRFGGL